MYDIFEENPEGEEEEDIKVNLTPEQERTKVFKIPSGNIEKLRAIIAKLDRKAGKYGISPIRLVEHGSELVKDAHGDAVKHYVVQIEGDAPKLAGWTFIGTAEPAQTTRENILRSAPGHVIPEKFRDTGTACDHCHERRYRKETYIVQHDSGEYKQVGSTCISDFLGGRSADDILHWFKLLHDALRETASATYGTGVIEYNLVRFLAYTYDAVMKYGWVSATKAWMERRSRDPPTATGQIAYGLMTERGALPPSPEGVEFARKAIEYGRTVLPSEPMPREPKFIQYQNNLITVSKQETISHTTLNLAASLLAKYNYWAKSKSMPARPAAAPAPVAPEGKNVFTVRVMGVREGTSAGFRGRPYHWILHTLQDEHGNTIKWFSKGEKLEVGKWYNLEGTLKYEVYKGARQAQLEYATVLGEAGGAGSPVKIDIIPLASAPPSEYESNPGKIKGVKLFCAGHGDNLKPKEKFATINTSTGRAFFCMKCYNSMQQEMQQAEQNPMTETGLYYPQRGSVEAKTKMAKLRAMRKRKR